MSSDALPSELYVPEFAPEWDRHQLHSLAKWVNGMAFKNIDFSPSGTPVVKIAEIKNGVSSQTKFTRATYDPKYFLRDGDMLFCWSGQPETSIDTYWWRGGDGWLNQHIFKVQPKPSDVDVDFFFQLLRYLRPSFVRIARNKQTTGLGHVTKSDLERLTVGIPARAEQLAIARLLGALDDKIESNRRAVASISDLLDAQSEKFGADLPTVPLGVVATSVKDTVNPSKLGDAVVDHFSLPAFDSGARPERVAATTIKSNKLRVPQRAVLLSRLNPRFNRTWWASTRAGTSALASTEFLVLTSEDGLELGAVWLAVRDPFFREELPKRVTGTSGSHQRVRPDDVLAIEVPDFRSAASEVKQSTLALLTRAESLRIESDRLTALRDTLLPELLSGHMRIPAEGVVA
ncbi:restriction endonuclease subunit S [Propionibacterium freudenreichii]|uniref:restriction endonuclease subunit S n=1 Tax=Propionibacterium freudenreichii TaxID=1744 RepID=UPI0005426940|nr:restriction endonuclease subunit S [Propionibacterium freudenreichii]MCT3003226.1 hypothetical protein [Propionibacterium freudenreichii]MDK9644973.1 restriction endonuclease subunit S [Propionibacterium freudenreichii]CEG86309.1 Type I restriction/modification system specificity determinant HsdS (S protein) [Propionibacterium freudenreichii]CEI24560.1 Type I restriction/modification system specificity determinant HsdS (S protein) [Propionibacterium freudenreichii]